MLNLSMEKSTKLSPKTFPKGVQNPAKWPGQNPENRLAASTKLPERFQDDFWLQHDPKMVQKFFPWASKMPPTWLQHAPYDMIIMTLQLWHDNQVILMKNIMMIQQAPFRSRAQDHRRRSVWGPMYYLSGHFLYIPPEASILPKLDGQKFHRKNHLF